MEPVAKKLGPRFSLFPRQRLFAALAGRALSRAHRRRQRLCGAELPWLRRLEAWYL